MNSRKTILNDIDYKIHSKNDSLESFAVAQWRFHVTLLAVSCNFEPSPKVPNNHQSKETVFSEVLRGNVNIATECFPGVVCTGSAELKCIS